MLSSTIGSKEQEYFERVLLPAFSQEFPDVHYTFDMFTNLARPYHTQDKRSSEAYWFKKAQAGDECFHLWEQILNFPILSSQLTPITNQLVQRLKRWYNEESARGFVRNPNSRGTNAPCKKVHDIPFLNRVCPEFAPWDEKQCKLLRNIGKDDNPFVAMMKRRFREYYSDKNESMLSLWSAERRFFYKNRDNMITFLSLNGINSDDKTNLCSMLKFSDNYNAERRKIFEENPSGSL